MKTGLILLTLLPTLSFADGIRGVDADTKVDGMPNITRAFCARELNDPAAECETWRKSVEAGLGGGTLIIKSECVESKNVICMYVGSYRGSISFVK